MLEQSGKDGGKDKKLRVDVLKRGGEEKSEQEKKKIVNEGRECSKH